MNAIKTPNGTNGPWLLRSAHKGEPERPAGKSTWLEVLDPDGNVQWRGMYFQAEHIGKLTNNSHIDAAQRTLQLVKEVSKRIGAENVESWLETSNQQLGGATPVEVIQDGRIIEIEELLAA